MYSIAMMMPYVIAAVAFFILIGSNSYRATAAVIFLVSLFNIGLGEIFAIVGERQWGSGPDNPYLYITAAAIDALTGLFLMAVALYVPRHSKMASFIAITLVASVFVNASMISQMMNGREFVYYNYAYIIFVVNCVLVLFFIGGIYESGRAIFEFFRANWRSAAYSFSRVYRLRFGGHSHNSRDLGEGQ